MTQNGLGTLIHYNPITVAPDSTLEQVLQYVNCGSVSDLPVVDADNRVVGLLSLEAIARVEVEQRAKPWTAYVSDMMDAHVLTLDRATTPQDALEQLHQRNVTSAPVVENGQLVGMIGVDDLTSLSG